MLTGRGSPVPLPQTRNGTLMPRFKGGVFPRWFNNTHYGVGVAMLLGVRPPVEATITTLWATTVVSFLVH